MAGNGIYSLGLLGPLFLLYSGFVLVGVAFSGTAIAIRLRAGTAFGAEKLQFKIDLSIVIFAASVMASICGGMLSHGGNYVAGVRCFFVSMFLLWPLSAVLAILGKGTSRRTLLIGHGLIALFMVISVVMSVIIYMK